MAKILFPSSTSPGRTPLESGGRLINAFSEALGPGAPAQFVIRRAPGAIAFANTGETTFRGGMFATPYAYAAYDGTLVNITSGGTVATSGALSGAGSVYFARNNRTPIPQLVCVSENGAFVFDNTAVSDLSDPDLPQPNSVCAHDGYFFFTIADGRCFSSALNDITVASTDYIRAESNPDGLLRGIPYGRDIILLGQQTGEVFTDVGNATGFPYSRVTVIPQGLIGPDAVAGWEAEFGVHPMFVSSDNKVYRLDGYTPVPISTPDLERLIDAEPVRTAIKCSVYVTGGHKWLQVKGSAFTWVYDLIAQTWHERRSWLSTISRMTGSFYAFDRWLVGDSNSGKLLEMSETIYREDGSPLVWTVESIAMEAFPIRLAVPRVDFSFQSGTGVANGEDPIERQPQVQISWSDDGGMTWATSLLRDIGAQSVSNVPISINRTGLSGQKGRRWRLTVSDPVNVAFLAGDMTAAGRA